jgi:hypothetical protein
MTEATEKQIKFARSLGIEDPETFSKEALSELINKKTGNKPSSAQKTAQNQSMGQIAATEGISQVNHHFQSSYEVGKAGARHTIKYFKLEELKARLEELQKAGLLEEFETVVMN